MAPPTGLPKLIWVSIESPLCHFQMSLSLVSSALSFTSTKCFCALSQVMSGVTGQPARKVGVAVGVTVGVLVGVAVGVTVGVGDGPMHVPSQKPPNPGAVWTQKSAPGIPVQPAAPPPSQPVSQQASIVPKTKKLQASAQFSQLIPPPPVAMQVSTLTPPQTQQTPCARSATAMTSEVTTASTSAARRE